MRLEQWDFVYSDSEQLVRVSPQFPGARLHGKVFGHPKHPEGTEITTSRVQQIEKGINCLLVYTLNSRYELGEPHPESVRRFPGELRTLGKHPSPYPKT